MNRSMRAEIDQTETRNKEKSVGHLHSFAGCSVLPLRVSPIFRVVPRRPLSPRTALGWPWQVTHAGKLVLCGSTMTSESSE